MSKDTNKVPNKANEDIDTFTSVPIYPMVKGLEAIKQFLSSRKGRGECKK